MRAHYLIDTSAVFRLLRDGKVGWEAEIRAGVIAVCPAVELEFLYSARSVADRRRKSELLRHAFAWVPMADNAFQRAAEVQQMLTEIGHHRSEKTVDLVIAATAERYHQHAASADYRPMPNNRVAGRLPAFGLPRPNPVARRRCPLAPRHALHRGAPED